MEIANGEYGKFNSILAEKCSKNKSPPPAVPPAIENEKHALQSDKMSVIVRRPHELYKFGVLFRRCMLQQYRDWVSSTNLPYYLRLQLSWYR